MIGLGDVYQALRTLDCALTRGWPQAKVPLPAIAFCGCEDSLGEDGTRRFGVELTVRAASPEGADALAGEAQAALAGLGLRRSYMKDGAEKDRDTYIKLLRYELRESPSPTQSLHIEVGGQLFSASLLYRRGSRALHELHVLDEAAPRLHLGPMEAGRLVLMLPGEALGPVVAAFEGGQVVWAAGQGALVEAFELQETGLKLSLCLCGEEAGDAEH